MARGGRLLPLSLLLLAGPAPAHADILHLKDGRSLKVEAWRFEGDQLAFEIAGGTVTVPRSLLVRVEATPAEQPPGAPVPAAKEPDAGGRTAPPVRPSPASPAPAPSSPRRPGKPPAAPKLPTDGELAALSDADLQKATDALKRKLRDRPQEYPEISRRIAVALSAQALRAAERKRGGAAESLFGEALTYDRLCRVALLGLSGEYLRQGKLGYARSQIEEALVEYPRDADFHALLGEVHYREEDVEEAIAQWEAAYALRADPAVAARLEKARREFSVDREFRRGESAHFTFRYEGEGAVSPALLDAVRDQLEGDYQSLAGKFQFTPPAPLVVILYPTRVFHAATLAPGDVGGLFDGKIRIPAGGLKGLGPDSRGLLIHELTHAFVHGKSGGRCPSWLQEGLAQLAEGKALRPSEERELARELAATGGKLPEPEEDLAYPAALSFTLYLTERFPFDYLVDALARMGAGAAAEDAIAEVTREPFDRTRTQWADKVVGRFVERP